MQKAITGEEIMSEDKSDPSRIFKINFPNGEYLIFHILLERRDRIVEFLNNLEEPHAIEKLMEYLDKQGIKENKKNFPKEMLELLENKAR